MSADKTATNSQAPLATCINVSACAIARSGDAIEWYAGAGEYCPDCGEALKPQDGMGPERVKPEPIKLESVKFDGNIAARLAAEVQTPIRRPTLVGDRVARNWNAASWTLAAVTVVVAGALSVYWEHRPDAAQRGIPGTIEVCAIPGAVQLAHDLIAGFAAKSGLAVQRFSVRNGNVCDVRFSSAAATPDAVIARDGIVAIVNPLNSIPRISERQLHDVFSGTIRDWAQLGGRPGKIVALLPEDSSDEAQAIASSILLGVKVDPGLRREASSADVTRVVAGAGQTSRRAIGLVAFSQSIPAKVLPLAYLPPPSVLSIGTRHYPYTMTIAVEIGSQRADSDARRLVDFATSNDGAQVVAKDGLVGRGDL